jgi:hypothetical protein
MEVVILPKAKIIEALRCLEQENEWTESHDAKEKYLEQETNYSNG